MNAICVFTRKPNGEIFKYNTPVSEAKESDSTSDPSIHIDIYTNGNRNELCEKPQASQKKI